MQFRWRWWESIDGISHGTTLTAQLPSQSSNSKKTQKSP
jgi:hypothetical protein